MVKRNLVKVAVVAIILLGSLGFAKEVNAAVPYGSVWSALYRNPEWSNGYGRIWYGVCNNKSYGYIYI